MGPAPRVRRPSSMIDKAVASVAAAVAEIRDGATIMLDITQNALLVTDIVAGLALAELERTTGVPLSRVLADSSST